MRVVLKSAASAVVWAARGAPDSPPSAASPLSRKGEMIAPSPTKLPALLPPVREDVVSVLRVFPSTVLEKALYVTR